MPPRPRPPPAPERETRRLRPATQGDDMFQDEIERIVRECLGGGAERDDERRRIVEKLTPFVAQLCERAYVRGLSSGSEFPNRG